MKDTVGRKIHTNSRSENTEVTILQLSCLPFSRPFLFTVIIPSLNLAFFSSACIYKFGEQIAPFS
jgi:hypothetical protein